MSDITYMEMAFDEALKGRKTVSPNPMVGAVIVKDNKIISMGHHKKSGDYHAEINAINNATESIVDATLFCTLEPCCHTNKKTPPCVPRIISEGFQRVVIANIDPNPEVAGKGIGQLREAGIEVEVGILKDLGFEINKVFFKSITKHLPYVHIKAALTIDGRMATSSNHSKWITSELARQEVHELRSFYDGVMVGSKTANADNPELTCRKGSEVLSVPKRIIIGNKCNLNNDLKLLNDAYKDSTIIVKEKSLKESLSKLNKENIKSILVEGGPTLITSLLMEGLVDEFSFYIAPKLIGNGPSLFNHDKFQTMNEAIKLCGKWRNLGTGEVVFEGRF